MRKLRLKRVEAMFPVRRAEIHICIYVIPKSVVLNHHTKLPIFLP